MKDQLIQTNFELRWGHRRNRLSSGEPNQGGRDIQIRLKTENTADTLLTDERTGRNDPHDYGTSPDY